MSTNQFYKIKFIPEKFLLENLIILLSDIFLLTLSFGIAVKIRSLLIPIIGGIIFKDLNLSLLAMLLVSNIILITINGNYPGRGTIAVIELKNIVQSISTAYFLTGGVIFLTVSTSNYSRSMYLMSWFLSCFFVPIGRFVLRKIFSLQPWWGEQVAIIGSPQEIAELYAKVKKCRRLGFRPVIGLYLPANGDDIKSTHLPFYPLSEEILIHLKENNIKTILVGLPPKEFRNKNPELFHAIEQSFIRSIFILDDISFGFLWGKPVDIESLPAFQMQHNLLNPVTRKLKNIIDYLLSIILFLPLSFVIFILSIIVWVDSPGKIFFTQERIGIYNKPFKIIKFRTMIPEADQILTDLLKDNSEFKSEYEKYHKLQNDPRLTRVGRWLRRFSLDELPQIFNVLKGEMSLIGPRAYMQGELEKMNGEGHIIFQVRPALTGWWQVMGRNKTSFTERTRLDVYYINNWSLWMDLYIFVKTFWVILTGEGR